MEKLESNKKYRLPNGADVFICSFDDGSDAIIYTPKTKNTMIHIYSPDFENQQEVGVCFYDNLFIGMNGSRKNKPSFVLRGDEWPCTLTIDPQKGKMEILQSTTKEDM